MKNELEIKQVPFMGTELMAARDSDGQIWAGVRWMCDGLGLSEGQRKRQIANIQADKVLSQGGSNLTLPTNGGMQNVLCLKLDFVPLWLAKISVTPTMEAETPELAANLERYQLQAKEALAAAFIPKEYQEPKSAMEYLRIQSQALFELDDRVTGLEDKVENQMTIDHGQQRQLQRLIGERVYERAGETIPPKELKASVGPFFKSLYKDLKNRFGVASYRDIRPADYADAIAYIEAWIEPADVRNGEGVR